MGTATIVISDDGAPIDDATVRVDFGVGGFDETSPAHLLAAELMTELASEANKND